jgi:hypothetical protein
MISFTNPSDEREENVSAAFIDLAGANPLITCFSKASVRRAHVPRVQRVDVCDVAPAGGIPRGHL